MLEDGRRRRADALRVARAEVYRLHLFHHDHAGDLLALPELKHQRTGDRLFQIHPHDEGGLAEKAANARGIAESPLSIAIDAWLAERGLTPRVVARCDDSALMKALAQRGFGVACVPTAIESDVGMIACQMTMDLFEYTLDDMIPGIELGGAATYIEVATQSDINLFI